MRTTVIYKRDSTGSIRTWQGEAVNGQWRSHAGLMGGNLVTSAWSDAPPKSQDTAERQAEFECLSQYNKLLGKDYRLTMELVDVPRGSWIKPMLAETYSTWPGPCYSQPKLDGFRCLANPDGLWSRGAKKFLSVPHISDALIPFFDEWPGVVLDGELYVHDDKEDNFNNIQSILKKGHGKNPKAPTAEQLELSKKIIQYHVYDSFAIDRPEMPFETRYQFLKDMLEFSGALWRVDNPDIQHDCIRIVPTLRCSIEDDVVKQHMRFLNDGYEGSILRLYRRPYEQKRSKTLLKFKSWITEEFKLEAINEGDGNWAGVAKTVTIHSSQGVEVKPGIRGNKAFCLALLSARVTDFESVTVRHFGMTPDGSLRFPTTVSLNEKCSFEGRPILDSNSTEVEF